MCRRSIRFPAPVSCDDSRAEHVNVTGAGFVVVEVGFVVAHPDRRPITNRTIRYLIRITVLSRLVVVTNEKIHCIKIKDSWKFQCSH